MTELRLLVAYDGTEFSGFQIQPNARTIQGVLEDALSRLSTRPVRVRGAGRTDAGVHALGQVVSIAEPGDLHPDVVMRALPSILPSDVAVVDAQSGPEGFDARTSARSRSYVYLLWCGSTPYPLYRRYAVWSRDAIDAARLSGALQTVVGTFDFSSFGRVREDQSPVRMIREATAVADGPFLRVSVIGDSFLQQMVRSIVGTALEVATGRKSMEWMRDALHARNRAGAGPVAPAQGLTLVDVAYDGAYWPRRPAVTWPWSGLAYVDQKRGCA